MLSKVNDKKGNVLLTAVIILSAFSLILATGIALTAIDNLNIAADYINGDRVRSLADSCSQDVLIQFSRNPSYTGGTFVLDDGECSISVTSSGANSIVQITASLDEYISEVETIIDTSASPFNIIQWKRGF